MAAISEDGRKRLIHAVASQLVGADIVNKLNAADQGAIDLFPIPNLIVASATSTTTDFASLAIGDKVVIIPAAAGNSQFVTVAVAGTLPQAAVVGSLYIVLRPVTAAPAATGAL